MSLWRCSDSVGNLNVVPTLACVALLVMYMTALRYCMYVQVQRMQMRPYMYMYVHAAIDIVIHVAEWNVFNAYLSICRLLLRRLVAR